MKQYIILDIDNCIADDAWRIPHIEHSNADHFHRYHKYHSLAPWDICFNKNLFYKAKLAQIGILLFTSRPVFYRHSTEEWLRRQGINYHALLMRNDIDHRSSAEVKQEQLSWLHEYDVGLQQIVAAYDDREPIVKMYKNFGINAEVIAIHEVDAYKGASNEKISP
jgi:hypothetical protein